MAIEEFPFPVDDEAGSRRQSEASAAELTRRLARLQVCLAEPASGEGP